jgi:hypothetical protein
MFTGRYVDTFESRYAWLPAVFHVADDGRDVRIDPNSYINGLGPRSRFPVLYRLIEKVFPHFRISKKHSVSSTHTRNRPLVRVYNNELMSLI